MRRLLSNVLLTAGSILAVLAAARLVFGIAIDLPILPSISLARVGAVTMIAGAISCFVAAALVGRRHAAAPTTRSRPSA
jgi:hypothetical protein